MKKTNFIPLIFTLLLTMLTSCSKDNSEYSCDSQINKWASETKAQFASATVEDIKTLDLERQRALFRTFTPEHKCSLWKEKLGLISIDSTLSNAEKIELTNLFSYLTPDHYRTDSGKQQFNQYAKVWENNMKSKYGWDDKKIFLYTHTWLSEKDFIDLITKESLESLKTRGTARGPQGPDGDGNCNCYYNVYCAFGSPQRACLEGDCTEPEGGCGVMGTTNCNGKCI